MKKLLVILCLQLSVLPFLSGKNFAADSKYPSEPVVFTEGASPLFPFHIENGSPDNITNIQKWGNPTEPAGMSGQIIVKGKHFVNTQGTKKFLGTNFCFTANFPDKEEAEYRAKSLARLGINLVRLHHMDSRDIWGKNANTNKTIIDPDQLDKLDYLIAQFKKNGVYVDINLHVSRSFGENEGFKNADKLPNMDKGLDNIDRRMIELQKKYAKDLLTHVNPYTGLAYTDDPCVAMIEINNENSMLASWFWGQLDSVPDEYFAPLKKEWNEKLLKKYGSTKKLSAAWNCVKIPLGEELVSNGNFPADYAKNSWEFQRDQESVCEWKTIESDDPKIGKSNFLHIEIEKKGKIAWIPQVHRVGLSVKKDQLYTFSFKLRGQGPKQINVGVLENHDPWGDLGLRTSVDVTKDWEEHVLIFKASKDDPKVRISFSNLMPGTIEIAAVSFRSGGNCGLPDDQTLEKGTVELAKKKNLPSVFLFSSQAVNDWMEFLCEKEDQYWQEMYHYVKDELKAKAPVTGTQLQYGTKYAQAKLDYCDIHAYWNHPNFPHRSWDSNDWWIGTKSLADQIVSGSATLPNLSMQRVFGRPFTCSEYDHPIPNLYAAEGNPMMAAIAAFQDWSGFMQFAWRHSRGPDQAILANFFDMGDNTLKRAHLPACYAMLVRGDVKAGPGKYIYCQEMGTDQEIKLYADQVKTSDYHRSLKDLGFDSKMALALYSGFQLPEVNAKMTSKEKTLQKITSWNDLPESMGSPDKKWIRNEFKELFFSFEEEGSGYFQVDTPKTKLFTGFIKGRKFQYKDMTIEFGKTWLDWATVSLVQCKSKGNTKAIKDNSKQLESGTYLLAITGFCRNTDSVYVTPKQNTVTTARDYGGNNGKSPELVEGVSMKLSLPNIDPKNVNIFALDGEGYQKGKVIPAAVDNGTIIQFGPEYKTVWYEIQIK